MLDFPSSRNGWRLDVVSILAILGEENISRNTLLITRSWTCLLPRLIPAPQALLRPRYKQLPWDEDVSVVGIWSGNTRKGLNYFGSMCRGTALPSFAVHTLRIDVRRPKAQPGTLFWRSQAPSNAPFLWIPYKDWGPLPTIAGASFVITMCLIAWAACIRDGVAVVGISIMSIAAPLICCGSYWQQKNFMRPPRPTDSQGKPHVEPPGDILMRFRNGSYMIVRCGEDIARLLFLGPDNVVYWMNTDVSMVVGAVIGGLLLTSAIVFFGNCTWTMQAAIGLTYVVLNAVYWMVAVYTMNRPKSSWDWSALTVVEEAQIQASNYTDAVFQAICTTRTTGWVSMTEALPKTEVWDRWLTAAKREADKNNSNWDARHAFWEINRDWRDEQGIGNAEAATPIQTK